MKAKRTGKYSHTMQSTFETMNSSAFNLSQISGSSLEEDKPFPSVDTGLLILNIEILGNAFFLPESAIRNSSHLPSPHNFHTFICICLQYAGIWRSWSCQRSETAISVGNFRSFFVRILNFSRNCKMKFLGIFIIVDKDCTCLSNCR